MKRLAMPASKMATQLCTLVMKPKYRFLSVKLASDHLCFHGWKTRLWLLQPSFFFVFVFFFTVDKHANAHRVLFPARTVCDFICCPVPSDPSFSPRTRTFRRKPAMNQWKSKIFLDLYTGLRALSHVTWRDMKRTSVWPDLCANVACLVFVPPLRLLMSSSSLA